MDITTWDGIIIGSAGGFIAGVAVWLTNLIWEKIIECRDKKRIYNWLYKVTKNEEKKWQWRSTRAIANHNNFTEVRVQYICSIHEKIVRNAKGNEVWRIR